MRFERQREADAALFEDWAPWAGLAYLMPEWGVIELRPISAAGDGLARQIPGIARSRRHGHMVRECRMPPWHLPLEHWRALRTALPAIQAADEADRARRAAEAARQERRLQPEIAAAVDARMASLTRPAGERTLGERIEVIVAAYLLRDRRLTAWERGFAAEIGDRWHRYGDGLAISDRQRAIVDRIHDKVWDTAAL